MFIFVFFLRKFKKKRKEASMVKVVASKGDQEYEWRLA